MLFNYKYWFILSCKLYSLWIMSVSYQLLNMRVIQYDIVLFLRRKCYVYITYNVCNTYLFARRYNSYFIMINYMNVKWAKKYNTLKNRSWRCSVYCRVFLKKVYTFSGNLEFFSPLHSHSRTAWQAFFTLALRDCPRWIIANVSRVRIPRSKTLYLASRFSFLRYASLWIFSERRRAKNSPR